MIAHTRSAFIADACSDLGQNTPVCSPRRASARPSLARSSRRLSCDRAGVTVSVTRVQECDTAPPVSGFDLPDADRNLTAFVAIGGDHLATALPRRRQRPEEPDRGCQTRPQLQTSCKRFRGAANDLQTRAREAPQTRAKRRARTPMFSGSRPCSLAFAQFEGNRETGFEPATARPPATALGFDCPSKSAQGLPTRAFFEGT